MGQETPTGCMSPTPALGGQQALHVLAGRDQQSLDVGVHHATYAEPAEAVPRLGLGKQGFDLDLPLADRLLAGLGRTVVADLLEGVDGEGSLDLATVVAGGARGFDRAGVADCGLATVGDHLLRVLRRIATEGMALGQRYASRTASYEKSSCP
jgi:hypothetical protein